MNKIVYIKAGEIFVGKDVRVRTVLGSCVSVCIFDKELKIGGMNHYLLPEDAVGQISDNHLNYAEHSIIKLLQKLKSKGCSKENLEVSIVGGGAPVEEMKNSNIDVGSANIKAARRVIKQFGLKISKEEVGGDFGREIEFSVSTGEIRFKKIQPNQSIKPTVADKNNKNNKIINVMIIDDSGSARKLLKKMIESDSSLKIIAEAEDPYQAMEIRKKIKPDVITLDINMPKMDGVSYLKHYMVSDPVPTIMVTSFAAADSVPVLSSLEIGAFDYMGKPTLTNLAEGTQEICEKIKAAYRAGCRKRHDPSLGGRVAISSSEDRVGKTLIALGASTGGTEAIKDILRLLPTNIPPIVIVQHIPPIFSRSFAESLNAVCAFKVKEAEDGDVVEKGNVYVARGGIQMALHASGGRVTIRYFDDPPVNRFKPSVDYLFNSIVKIKSKLPYEDYIGVLLTGMGSDGAKGLLELKRAGSSNIVQDEESCVVFGMPKCAIDLGAHDYIVHLDKIAAKLSDLISAKITKGVRNKVA